MIKIEFIKRLQSNAGITLFGAIGNGKSLGYFFFFEQQKSTDHKIVYDWIEKSKSLIKIDRNNSPLLGIFVRWLLDHTGYQMWCRLVDLPNTAFYLLISFYSNLPIKRNEANKNNRKNVLVFFPLFKNSHFCIDTLTACCLHAFRFCCCCYCSHQLFSIRKKNTHKTQSKIEPKNSTCFAYNYAVENSVFFLLLKTRNNNFSLRFLRV